MSIYESDIAALLNAYPTDVRPLLEELAEHLSDTDLASLRDILADIRGRLERFRRGLGGEPNAGCDMDS